MSRLAGVVTKATIRVVAAVIYDPEGRVLIAKRPAGKSLAGSWEFPGGKIEPEENGKCALQRELLEELGISASALRPVFELRHEYPERHVELSVWVVDQYTGVPAGLEGQPLRWEKPAALRSIGMLPADLPIIDWLEK